MKREGHIRFDSSDKIYGDHFPGHPVVPGSVIVQAFIRAIGLECTISGLDLSQFRFKRFVSPGTYRYTLEQHEDEVRCSLYDGDQAVATGKVAV